MSLKNKAFKFFAYLGPVFILLVFAGLLSFIFFNLYQNFTELSKEQTCLSIFLELFADLKSPIAGTLLITISSVAISTPIGIITGIYLHEYAGEKIRIHGINLFKYLSTIPSIIIGVFGLVMIISINQFFDRNLRTGLTVSALSLSLLILPYIVQSTVNALSMIPKDLRVTALSIGAKKHQNIIYILLPECITAILGGVVLSIGRAAEDTAVIMLTGAAAFAGIPSKFNDAFEALPFFIYYKSSESQGTLELAHIFTASLIIIVISTLFIFSADKITQKFHRKLKGIK